MRGHFRICVHHPRFSAYRFSAAVAAAQINLPLRVMSCPALPASLKPVSFLPVWEFVPVGRSAPHFCSAKWPGLSVKLSLGSAGCLSPGARGRYANDRVSRSAGPPRRKTSQSRTGDAVSIHGYFRLCPRLRPIDTPDCQEFATAAPMSIALRGVESERSAWAGPSAGASVKGSRQ